MTFSLLFQNADELTGKSTILDVPLRIGYYIPKLLNKIKEAAE